jgi:hypothetical protein
MDPLDELEQQAKDLEKNMIGKSEEEILNSIDSLLSSLDEKLEIVINNLTKE